MVASLCSFSHILGIQQERGGMGKAGRCLAVNVDRSSSLLAVDML